MSLLFLSHSSRDDRAADVLNEWLRSEGHEAIFSDHSELEGVIGGEAWEERLYTELRRCRALIALVSSDWLRSAWCVAEASHAQALRKAVIPLRITDLDAQLFARRAPPVLHRVQAIDWCKDAQARLRLGEALARAGLDPKDTFTWKGDRDPYPGLVSFEAEDVSVYFGREQEITELLALLNGCRAPGRPRIVFVQGASGTGKSSLVRAGILPRLARDPGRWLLVPPFRPLRTPFSELMEALSLTTAGMLDASRSHGLEGQDATAELADWIGAAALALRRSKGRLEATVLLTIDQLEEALGDETGAGTAFLLALRDALAGADHRLLVLATLRADYIGTLQRHPALRDPANDGEILQTHPFQLGALPRRSFARVIEGPAELAGLRIEPGLTSQLVQDASSDDALPLLAFVLRELWDRGARQSRELTYRAYESFGGLENAVGTRAEELFSELAPSEQEIEAFRIALLFGMADLTLHGQVLRRRLLLVDVPPLANRLIDAFADPRARLFTKGNDYVEVTHEALYRRWPRLVEWLQPGMEILDARQRIEHAYDIWESEQPEGKASRLLPPGRPLEEACRLLDMPLVLQDTGLRAYVAESKRVADLSHRRDVRRRVIIVSAIGMTVLTGVGAWRYVVAQRRIRMSDLLVQIIYSIVDDSGTGESHALDQILREDVTLELVINPRGGSNTGTTGGWPGTQPLKLLREGGVLLTSIEQSASKRQEGSTAGYWAKSIRTFHLAGDLGLMEDPGSWNHPLFEARLQAVESSNIQLRSEAENFAKTFDEFYDLDLGNPDKWPDYTFRPLPIMAILNILVSGRTIAAAKGYATQVQEHDEDAMGRVIIYFGTFTVSTDKPGSAI